MPDEGPTRKSADEDPQIKVTDKRMFTPDGRLREEYSFLERAEDSEPSTPTADASASPVAPPSTPEPAPRPEPETPVPPPAAPPPAAAPPEPHAPSEERPRRPDMAEFSGPQSVGVLDLVAMLAETAAVYLGDAQLPDGSTGEHLEMARVHIDLLEVLRQKTAGNLSPQESAALEDVLYRLRVRYVQKRG